MLEQQRPSLSETAQRYNHTSNAAARIFGGEGKRLRASAERVYAEVVDLLAKNLLGNRGQDGRELLYDTISQMYSLGSTPGEKAELFLAVAVRIAEIAGESQQGAQN